MKIPRLIMKILLKIYNIKLLNSNKLIEEIVQNNNNRSIRNHPSKAEEPNLCLIQFPKVRAINFKIIIKVNSQNLWNRQLL